MMHQTAIKTRQPLRDEIAAQIQEYLDGGGEIYQAERWENEKTAKFNPRLFAERSYQARKQLKGTAKA